MVAGLRHSEVSPQDGGCFFLRRKPRPNDCLTVVKSDRSPLEIILCTHDFLLASELKGYRGF